MKHTILQRTNSATLEFDNQQKIKYSDIFPLYVTDDGFKLAPYWSNNDKVQRSSATALNAWLDLYNTGYHFAMLGPAKSFNRINIWTGRQFNYQLEDKFFCFMLNDTTYTFYIVPEVRYQNFHIKYSTNGREIILRISIDTMLNRLSPTLVSDHLPGGVSVSTSTELPEKYKVYWKGFNIQTMPIMHYPDFNWNLSFPGMIVQLHDFAKILLGTRTDIYRHETELFDPDKFIEPHSLDNDIWITWKYKFEYNDEPMEKDFDSLAGNALLKSVGAKDFSELKNLRVYTEETNDSRTDPGQFNQEITYQQLSDLYKDLTNNGVMDAIFELDKIWENIPTEFGDYADSILSKLGVAHTVWVEDTYDKKNPSSAATTNVNAPGYFKMTDFKKSSPLKKPILSAKWYITNSGNLDNDDYIDDRMLYWGWKRKVDLNKWKQKINNNIHDHRVYLWDYDAKSQAAILADSNPIRYYS